MTYNLITTLETEKDIDKAVEWYIDVRKFIAQQFIAELRAVKNYIHKNPEKIAIRYDSVRVAFFKKFPYGLHYTFNNNTITIVVLFHTAESPQKWNKR
jgi:hypothetical protein